MGNSRNTITCKANAKEGIEPRTTVKGEVPYPLGHTQICIQVCIYLNIDKRMYNTGRPLVMAGELFCAHVIKQPRGDTTDERSRSGEGERASCDLGGGWVEAGWVVRPRGLLEQRAPRRRRERRAREIDLLRRPAAVHIPQCKKAVLETHPLPPWTRCRPR